MLLFDEALRILEALDVLFTVEAKESSVPLSSVFKTYESLSGPLVFYSSRGFLERYFLMR